MSELVLADNDLVFKLAAYSRHSFLISGLGPQPASVLPATKFVLRDLARRSRRIINREAVIAAVEEAIGRLAVIDPSPAEIALAAQLEEAAKAQSLELDTGESQLLAIALTQGIRLLMTGDKRAVVAIEALAAHELGRRIACLEQVLEVLLDREPVEDLRTAICAEPNVDAAAAIIFSCCSEHRSKHEIEEGLHSYISDLAKVAARTLAGEKLA